MAMMRIRGISSLALAGTIVLAWACPRASAAPPAPAAAPVRPAAEEPFDISADQMAYEADGRTMTCTGHVAIRRGGQVLQADFIQVNDVTKDAYARGNVTLVRPNGATWSGPELRYNFQTEQGQFGNFHLYVEPFHVYGDDTQVLTRGDVRVKNLVVTTCEGDPADAEFKLVAREGRLTDERYLRARNVQVCLGGIPIFILPWYNKDLKSSGRWDFIPGYSSRLGAYLLTIYNYPLNGAGTFKGATGVYVYGKRGVGYAQGFTWRDLERTFRGELHGFYIDDRKIYRNAAERLEREEWLAENDTQRYRVRFGHTARLGDRDYFITRAAYLSDPYVQQDFFKREWRAEPVPENLATLSHLGEGFSAALNLNQRINDFYDNVNRAPEGRVDVYPIQLGESSLFYEGAHSAARLERVYDAHSDNEAYEALRLDSYNLLSYPGRYFGFLSFTPRLGSRTTYYSKTRGDEFSVTNVVTFVDTNGVSSTSNRVDTTRPEEGADVRQLFEIGFETSFKAYKVLDEGDNTFGSGLRHVVEPYLRHTYIPEPSLTRDHIYQFDEIDRLDQEHTLRLGLRNKLQTRTQSVLYTYRDDPLLSGDRRRGAPGPEDETFLEAVEPSAPGGERRVNDLLDLDVYTIYRIRHEVDEHEFSPIYFDLQARPGQIVRLDFRMAYDMYDSQLQYADTQLGFRFTDVTVNLDHIYRPDQRNLVALETHFFPRQAWSFGTYHRFDIDAGELEEQSVYLQRRLSCVGFGIGVTHEPAQAEGEEDDLRVSAQFWLLAMPQTGIGDV